MTLNLSSFHIGRSERARLEPCRWISPKTAPALAAEGCFSGSTPSLGVKRPGFFPAALCGTARAVPFLQLMSPPLSFVAHIRPVDGSIHTDRVGRPLAIARFDNAAGISRAAIKAASRNDCLALITTIVGLPYSFSGRLVAYSEVSRLLAPKSNCGSLVAALCRDDNVLGKRGDRCGMR